MTIAVSHIVNRLAHRVGVGASDIVGEFDHDPQKIWGLNIWKGRRVNHREAVRHDVCVSGFLAPDYRVLS
jgi:hypothetical protein